MKDMELNIYSSMKTKESFVITLDQVVDRILNGIKDIDTKTQTARKLKSEDADRYKVYKYKKLPAVIFGIRVKTTGRSAEKKDGKYLNFISHNNLVVHDIDNLTEDEIQAHKERIIALPSTVLCFVSPSGNGLKAVSRVDAENLTFETHSKMFHAVATKLGITDVHDGPCSDPNRLCLLAYDPEAYVNYDATPMIWQDAVKKDEPKPEQKVAEGGDVHEHFTPRLKGLYDPNVLDHLNPTDYHHWTKVGMACHQDGLSIDIWIEWSKGTQKPEGYKHGDCEKWWKTFGNHPHPIGWSGLCRFAEELEGSTYVRPEHVYFRKKSFKPAIMAEELMEEYDIVKFRNHPDLYIWKDGVYLPDTNDTIKHAVYNKIGCDAKPIHATSTIEILETKCAYKSDHSTSGFPFQNDRYINCKNGIYDIKDRAFRTHAEMPDYRSLIQIPVNFVDYSADETPVNQSEIFKFLIDVLKGNAHEVGLACQIMGYCLLQSIPIPKLFVIYGPTHTGKSTFLSIIRKLLGRANVSAVSLQSLDDESLRFARSGIYGKLANISGDLSQKTLAGDSKIKEITAGDAMTVEHKGTKAFEIEPFAKLIAACNELPKSRDKSSGWTNRLVILPFTKQHEGSDAKRGYINELTTDKELSSALWLAIQGLHSLLDAGDFVESESTQNARTEYELLNDQIKQFLTEEEWVASVEYSDTTNVYDAYKDWAEEESIKHVSKTKFVKSVEKILGIKQKKARVDGTRVFQLPMIKNNAEYDG